MSWLKFLALLAAASAATNTATACSPMAPMVPSVAPDKTTLPDSSHSKFAFLAVVVGRESEPATHPVIRLRVIDSRTENVAAGDVVDVEFYQFHCPGQDERPAEIDVSAYKDGTWIRVVSNYLQLDTGRVGWEFTVIGEPPSS